MTSLHTFIDAVQSGLAAQANRADAVAMAAYMKTEMPFYGVKRPALRGVWREVRSLHRPTTFAEYRSAVLALWQLPHREAKYLALTFARYHKQFLTGEAVPLVEHLIRDGAWWDLVDEIAIHCMGRILAADAAQVQVLDRWIQERDQWVRRAAVLAQNRYLVDPGRLYRYCLAQADEPSFWLRKAIAWALREHGGRDPKGVAAFLRENGAVLSPLSQREASRKLVASGVMAPHWVSELAPERPSPPHGA